MQRGYFRRDPLKGRRDIPAAAPLVCRPVMSEARKYARIILAIYVRASDFSLTKLIPRRQAVA